MAGPTSSVLLQAIPGPAILAAIHTLIDEFAAERNGNDFYIKASDTILQAEALRPFGFGINQMGEDGFHYTPYELQSLASYAGYIPLAEVVLFAMCNDAIDHHYLGIVTLRMASITGGLVNFGGMLPVHHLSKLKSPLHTIEYVIANGETANYHVSNAAFLREWLQHDHFRMVK